MLVDRSVEIVRVELDEGQARPDWHDFDLMVVMGGPMGAYETATHPWMAGEIASMGDAARSGHPVWGVCLGAQLLAAGLGARVYPGPAPEVGVLPVTRSDASRVDPVFCVLDRKAHTLQWHGDTFDLPSGAELLASSPAYPHQAFRFQRSYGLQFHLEVSRSMAAEWARVPAYEAALDRVLGPGSWPALERDLDARVDEMGQLARNLFGRWLDQVVG